jgi:ATP-dependent Clp protease, protease subunit
MIHNPQGKAFGDAAEMQRVAALLDQVKSNLTDTYAGRTAQPRDKLAAWMDDETWLAADTAVQYGFADRVTNEQPVAACWSLDHYKHVPDQLRARAAGAVRSARDIAAVRIAKQAEAIRRMQA